MVTTSQVKRYGWSALCVMALGLAACTTPNVRYDYDAKNNFSQYHTYVIESVSSKVDRGGDAFKNPLNEQRLKDAVQNEMTARGLRLVSEGEEPDTYVTIAVGNRDVSARDDRSRVRVGFGFGTWHPGFGSSLYIVDDGLYDYREGRITVDLYEAKTRKALWHATVEQDLSYLTRDDADKRIKEVVAAMFAKFPIAASH